MKTALIIDVANMYFQTQRAYGNYRINYDRYLNNLRKQGLNLTHMFAFGHQRQADVPAFSHLMKSLGFTLRFGNVSWNVEIALQMARIVNNIECFVLGSSEPELGRLFVFAKEHGVICRCNAVQIPTFFKNTGVICQEVDETLLDAVNYEPKDSTQQLELRSNFNGNVVKS